MKDKGRKFKRFLDIINRLHINIPFIKPIKQMPIYKKFVKGFLIKKKRILEEEAMELEVGCSAIFQKPLP